MKALLLLGGLGTRLRPLTLHRPKPLLPVMNRPLIAHQLEGLRAVGVREVVLALGHKAAHFRRRLGDGRRWGYRFRYSVETAPLGTGGAVRNALKFLDGTTMVLNGDIISDLDPRLLLRAHRRVRAQATLALVEVPDPSAFGVVQSDRAGRITAFLEKPAPGRTSDRSINAGHYVFEPEVVRRIPPGRAVSIEREIFPALIQEGYRFFAWTHRGYWSDVGTLPAYWRTHRDLHERGLWPADARLRGGVRAAPGARPGRGLTRRGTALLGRSVRLGAGCRLEGPVTLGDGVRVGAGVLLSGCVVLEGARIGDRARIEGAVIGARAVIGADARLGPGLVLGDGARWPAFSQTAPGLSDPLERRAN